MCCVSPTNEGTFRARCERMHMTWTFLIVMYCITSPSIMLFHATHIMWAMCGCLLWFLFFLANIPLFLYPFLNSVSKQRPFEYLRLTSLGVVGALVKVSLCTEKCVYNNYVCMFTLFGGGWQSSHHRLPPSHRNRPFVPPNYGIWERTVKNCMHCGIRVTHSPQPQCCVYVYLGGYIYTAKSSVGRYGIGLYMSDGWTILRSKYSVDGDDWSNGRDTAISEVIETYRTIIFALVWQSTGKRGATTMSSSSVAVSTHHLHIAKYVMLILKCMHVYTIKVRKIHTPYVWYACTAIPKLFYAFMKSHRRKNGSINFSKTCS